MFHISFHNWGLSWGPRSSGSASRASSAMPGSSAGQSLAAQMEALEAAGAETIYSEKVSGARDDRPQLAKLMATLQAGESGPCLQAGPAWPLDPRASRPSRGYRQGGRGVQVARRSLWDTSTAAGSAAVAYPRQHRRVRAWSLSASGLARGEAGASAWRQVRPQAQAGPLSARRGGCSGWRRASRCRRSLSPTAYRCRRSGGWGRGARGGHRHEKHHHCGGSVARRVCLRNRRLNRR